MCIVVYVSGHGLGHSAREIALLPHLPPDIPLVVKTVAPRWFWDLEMPRPVTRVEDVFDVGCVQKNGLDIDLPATLAAWQEMDVRNRGRVETEAEDLRRRGARLVVSDVPSLALSAARQAGIPSACVCNFTWADIYRRFVDDLPAFGTIADRLEEEYTQADVAITTGFDLPMPYFPRKMSVGFTARTGQSRRDDLLRHLPPGAAQKRLALVYVGGWGLPIAYERVTAFRDWHFISLDAPPTTPANWTTLPKGLLDHRDLVASVDLAISKPGYGLAVECVTLGTPHLYPPRPSFAEYFALDVGLSQWAGGLRIPIEPFLAVDWAPYLEQVPPRGSLATQPAPGGIKAAEILARLYRGEKI